MGKRFLKKIMIEKVQGPFASWVTRPEKEAVKKRNSAHPWPPKVKDPRNVPVDV